MCEFFGCKCSDKREITFESPSGAFFAALEALESTFFSVDIAVEFCIGTFRFVRAEWAVDSDFVRVGGDEFVIHPKSENLIRHSQLPEYDLFLEVDL